MTPATGKQLEYLYALQRKLEGGTEGQKKLGYAIRHRRNKVHPLDKHEASDLIDSAKNGLDS